MTAPVSLRARALAASLLLGGAASILVLAALTPTAWAADTKHAAFLAADEGAAPTGGGPALAEAEAKLDAAWDRLPLKVQRAVFVFEKADLYGAYHERSNATFRSGETLQTYIEPIGYSFGKADEGFVRFGVSMDVEVVDADGTVVTGKKNFASFAATSRARLKEFMLNASLDLHDAPAGTYEVRYTIYDLNSSKSAETKLPFTIVE